MNTDQDQNVASALQIAQIVPATDAEGPGRRFAIWFQGCPFRCPGCCNPEMLLFAGGQTMTVESVLTQIKETQRQEPIEGVTLLGGEPFAHAAGASYLATRIQELDLSVMIFSGYTLGELQANEDADVAALLKATDILVDGLYDRDDPDTTRRWIGSKNQQIHFLSSKYQADDPRWQQSDTLEIRLQDGQLTVNGFPARQAVQMWKRPRRK